VSKIWRRLTRRGDERGAILVMATVGVVLAVIATALAVDVGTLAQEKRRAQKVADLAALDAVRDVPANYQARAVESALRNGLPTSAGYSVVAVEGTKVNGACVASAGAGTACVTVTAPHKNNFLAGNQVVKARAVAGTVSSAGFTIGSSLASANLDDLTTNVPILNRVMGRLLGGATGQANLVSYKGLADATVGLGALKTALSFGTVNELLTSTITMGQLLTATATVLNNQGTVAALSARDRVNELKSVTTNSTSFKLGDYIHVAQGSEDKALAGDVNVLQLITAGAELANKNSFIDAGGVINLPVTLPAPLNTTAHLTTTLGLTVIQPAQLYIGPVGGTVHTAQVNVTLTPHIDVNFTSPLLSLLTLLPLLGNPVSNLRIVGDMPTTFSGAAADGTMEDIRCSGTPGITVKVVSSPITTHTSLSASVFLQGITDLITGNIKVGVTATPTDVATTAGGPYHVVFNYPNDFSPTDPDGQTTPGAPAGITLTDTTVNTTVGAAGLTQVVGLVTGTITLANVESAIIGPILNPVFNAVANSLTTPALKALGINIGPVDVTAPAKYFDPAACGQPGLLA